MKKLLIYSYKKEPTAGHSRRQPTNKDALKKKPPLVPESSKKLSYRAQSDAAIKKETCGFTDDVNKFLKQSPPAVTLSSQNGSRHQRGRILPPPCRRKIDFDTIFATVKANLERGGTHNISCASPSGLSGREIDNCGPIDIATLTKQIHKEQRHQAAAMVSLDTPPTTSDSDAPHDTKRFAPASAPRRVGVATMNDQKNSFVVGKPASSNARNKITKNKKLKFKLGGKKKMKEKLPAEVYCNPVAFKQLDLESSQLVKRINLFDKKKTSNSNNLKQAERVLHKPPTPPATSRQLQAPPSPPSPSSSASSCRRCGHPTQQFERLRQKSNSEQQQSVATHNKSVQSSISGWTTYAKKKSSSSDLKAPRNDSKKRRRTTTDRQEEEEEVTERRRAVEEKQRIVGDEPIESASPDMTMVAGDKLKNGAVARSFSSITKPKITSSTPEKTFKRKQTSPTCNRQATPARSRAASAKPKPAMGLRAVAIKLGGGEQAVTSSSSCYIPHDGVALTYEAHDTDRRLTIENLSTTCLFDVSSLSDL